MRREHIASPRSPPVRGLATDSGRRSGNQFYGGRSVQKGELEFKPMFNKKNIAKLLVFAMILTMLPVSSIAAGGDGGTVNRVDSFTNSYVTVKDVMAKGDGNVSYTLKCDTNKLGDFDHPYEFVYDTDVDTETTSISLTVEPANGKGKVICGVYKLDKDVSADVTEFTNNNNVTRLTGNGTYTCTPDTGTKSVKLCIVTKAAEGNNPPLEKTYILVTLPNVKTPSVGETTYEIKLDAVSVEKGKTATATATLSYKVGNDAYAVTAGTVAWEITGDNTSYAKVTANGNNNFAVSTDKKSSTATATVTGKEVGETTLKVTYTKPGGGTETATAKVTVTENKTPETATYTITVDAVSVKKGGTTTATATLSYKVGNDTYAVTAGTVVWEITGDNSNCATVTENSNDFAVSEDGKSSTKTATVTGNEKGETTLKVTYTAPSKETKEATATVTVTDDETPTGPYTITLDAVETLAGGTVDVTAKVEYTVDGDAEPKKATDGTVKWEVDSAYATVEDTSTTVSEGTTTNTITATQKVGGTKIKLTYAKQDGETLAETEVDFTVKPVDLTKLHFVTSNITGGSVTYTQNVIEDKENNAYKAQKDAKVSFELKPLDSTYKLYADSVNVYKVGNDTAEPLTDNKNNVYTFTMPDCDVIIMVVFTKAAEDVDVTMDIDGLKAGYALPEPTAISLEGATVTVKWFGPDGEEVTGAFPTEGDYTYEFTVTLADGTVLDNASVNYTVNKGPVESVQVGPKDERAAYWRYVETDNVAGGDLIIKGTSADKFYLIAETTTMSGVSVSAYVIVQGGAKGEIKVPCAGGSVVSIWETPDSNGSTEAEGVDQFVNEKSAENDLPGLPDEDSEETFSENRREGVERTGRITQSDVTWEYVEEDNVAGGNLIINNTSANRYYLIAETTTMSGVSVSAYVIVQGNDGTISVPCMGGSVVSIWETPDPNGSTETEGVDQFVNEKGAEEDLQGGT